MTKRSAMPTYAQPMWNTPLVQRTIPFRSTTSGSVDPAGLKMMVVALIPLSLLSAARGAVARRSEQLLLHDRDKLVSRLQLLQEVGRQLGLQPAQIRRPRRHAVEHRAQQARAQAEETALGQADLAATRHAL